VAFVASLAWVAYFHTVLLGHHPAPPGALGRNLALDVLLFATFGAHHSLCARERVKRVMARWIPAPLERTTYVWIASVLLALVCVAWQPIPGGELYRLPGGTAWIGRGVQLLGVLLTARTARLLDVLELAGIRQARGDTRPPRLEIVGPYRWVRHPLYLAWVLIVFGVPAMTADHLAFAALSTGYLLAGLQWEERSLAATLGEPYRAYLRHVRWRVLPYVY
jgi:protein-S-isoprenylcysteine O-methyltransferase Ste14